MQILSINAALVWPGNGLIDLLPYVQVFVRLLLALVEANVYLSEPPGELLRGE